MNITGLLHPMTDEFGCIWKLITTFLFLNDCGMVLVPDTSQIVGQLYNVSLVIAGPHLSLKEVAELFAKVAIAGYDSSILGWYQKFEYLFWRPITALRSILFTLKVLLSCFFFINPKDKYIYMEYSKRDS